VGPGCVLCPRIDPIRFLAGCCRRRLNQGLVVALGFSHCQIWHVFVLFFSVYGYMLCLVRYLFVISTSVIDCLGRFVPEMTYYVSSGMLNLAQLNSTHPPIPAYHYHQLPMTSIIQCQNMLRFQEPKVGLGDGDRSFTVAGPHLGNNFSTSPYVILNLSHWSSASC